MGHNLDYVTVRPMGALKPMIFLHIVTVFEIFLDCILSQVILTCSSVVNKCKLKKNHYIISKVPLSFKV